MTDKPLFEIAGVTCSDEGVLFHATHDSLCDELADLQACGALGVTHRVMRAGILPSEPPLDVACFKEYDYQFGNTPLQVYSVDDVPERFIRMLPSQVSYLVPDGCRVLFVRGYETCELLTLDKQAYVVNAKEEEQLTGGIEKHVYMIRHDGAGIDLVTDTSSAGRNPFGQLTRKGSKPFLRGRKP